MKNLLKLSLLLSALVIGGLNAIQVQQGGEYFTAPDKITIVNDLNTNMIVNGKVLVPGAKEVFNKAALDRLQGHIEVRKANGELLHYFTYLYLGDDFPGMKMETFDEETKNLSEIFGGLKAR